MKGVVFTEFSEMVEDRFGLAVADAVLEASPNKGSYTAVGDYDFRELVAMVGDLAERTSLPAATLVEAFGHHLFGRFVEAYGQMFVGISTALDLLEKVEDHIHVQVRKLYPKAELPRFDVERDGSTLYMTYRSPRCLSDLARGLIQGCLDHYETSGTVTAQPQNDAGSVVRFKVTVDD